MRISFVLCSNAFAGSVIEYQTMIIIAKNVFTCYAINSNHIHRRCITIKSNSRFMRAVTDVVFRACALKSTPNPVWSCAVPKLTGSCEGFWSLGEAQHPADDVGSVDVPGSRGVVPSCGVAERSSVEENLTTTRTGCGSTQCYVCQGWYESFSKLLLIITFPIWTKRILFHALQPFKCSCSEFTWAIIWAAIFFLCWISRTLCDAFNSWCTAGSGPDFRPLATWGKTLGPLAPFLPHRGDCGCNIIMIRLTK